MPLQPHNPVLLARLLAHPDLPKSGGVELLQQLWQREHSHLQRQPRSAVKAQAGEGLAPPVTRHVVEALPGGRCGHAEIEELRKVLGSCARGRERHAEHERAARLEQLVRPREGALHGWGDVLEDIRGEQEIQRPVQRRVGLRDIQARFGIEEGVGVAEFRRERARVAAPIRQPNAAELAARGELGQRQALAPERQGERVHHRAEAHGRAAAGAGRQLALQVGEGDLMGAAADIAAESQTVPLARLQASLSRAQRQIQPPQSQNPVAPRAPVADAPAGEPLTECHAGSLLAAPACGRSTRAVA